MMLPKRLIIYSYAYALDGGTTVLQATDESGQPHCVMLVQHSWPELNSALEGVPGRLYFDGELVPLRSDSEAAVLALLRAAEVRYFDPSPNQDEQIQLSPNMLILGQDIRDVLNRGPEDNIRTLTAAVVVFVESEEYLRFADRVEQAADTTRYTVWVDLESTNRNQAIVRLARILKGGMQAARQFLDSMEPLAEDATALEVSDLFKRHSVEDLTLRIQPPFRWRLE